MPRRVAERELLAPRADVWKVLAEPYLFADWWPGVSGVRPDRRGFAAGARWEVFGGERATLFRRPRAHGLLVVRAVEPYERFAFHLTGPRLDVELRVSAPRHDRTGVRLELGGPGLLGFNRALAARALARLHALCQTAADF
jgi:uncharacterized protein YndB with AHSA1/START domain